MIDLGAFLLVFVTAMIGTVVVVSAYSLGVRLLTLSGRSPIVTPAEFTDAITVVTPAEIRQAEKRAAKAAKKSPLSERQKRLAFFAAVTCFVVSGLAVIFGLYLIVGEHIIKLFT